MMLLEKYIRENPDWETSLTEKPYFLNISRDGNFILFKYNQLQSDFSIPLVREARGVIFSANLLIPVCVPFFKFFNYGESNADEIDWSSAKVQEKIDGSIIKLYYWYGWHVSTNGTIDAYKAELPGLVYKSYGELFSAACEKTSINYSDLNPNYTYIFELVSPYNRIVVPYENTEIYHIGTRDNITLQELDIDISIQKPFEYPLQTLDECLDVAKKFPFSQEGFVVVDKNYNRVKIKSPAYVAAHRLVNNHVITYDRILDLVMQNEQDEFLVYFPEYSEYVKNVENAISEYLEDLQSVFGYLETTQFNSKKEFALFVMSNENIKKYSDILFLWYDGKLKVSLKEWFYSLSTEKILSKIGLKE